MNGLSHQMLSDVISDILDPWLDATHKGFPQQQPPTRRSQIGVQGWQVLAGDLPLPLAVVKRSALDHNLGWMRRFCEERGVGLAPHGKTTMSPQLFQRQQSSGAWGISFATVAQLRVGVLAGVKRALIANQVLQTGDLRAITAMKAQHAGLRVLFLLDSLQQLALIEATRPAEPFEVLLEIGLLSGKTSGRTGCRSHDEAMTLARAVRDSVAVSLAGIECYEGGAAQGDSAADSLAVQALMGRVKAVALQADAEHCFQAGELIISAGGSAVFDLVVAGLRLQLSQPVQGLLRSGCYITHDHGTYRRMQAVMGTRIGCTEGNGLQAALEVWAVVQSLPEPGLAILSVGRRDLSYDIELPIPIAQCPLGHTVPQPVPTGWTISALNDQHAYLRMDASDPACSLRVGDRIGLGISHPCTTFDKWRWMPLIDDNYRVVDALITCF